MSKRSEARKAHFYNLSIQYVKKRKGGIIHPNDTSYDKLAFILETYLNKKSEGTSKQRCLVAATALGILDSSQYKKQFARRQQRLNFYSSLRWKKLRYATLVKHGAKCQCCGASGKNVRLQVDHIKPISKFWELRLDQKNVQILCDDCNWGKLNLDQTDWR